MPARDTAAPPPKHQAIVALHGALLATVEAMGAALQEVHTAGDREARSLAEGAARLSNALIEAEKHIVELDAENVKLTKENEALKQQIASWKVVELRKPEYGPGSGSTDPRGSVPEEDGD